MDDKRYKDELSYEIYEEPQLMEVPLEKPKKRSIYPTMPLKRVPKDRSIKGNN